MSDEKTYVFGDRCQDSLLASMNGGGMWNNPIWAIVLLAFLRNGFGWGGESNGSNGFISAQLGQAIQGNANAISNLATSLNCTEGQILGAVNAVQSAIQSVGAQNNLSFAQTVNAVNAGNANIISTLQSCCCDLKTIVNNQGYENRIANTEQTAILGGKIDNQTTLINDKFCQLEMRGMQDKIDSLREEKATLKGVIDNANQTAAIQNYVTGLINPLAADVASIKCKLPQTVQVPYSPVTAIPSCVAWNYGLQSLGLGYGTGSIWS